MDTCVGLLLMASGKRLRSYNAAAIKVTAFLDDLSEEDEPLTDEQKQTLSAFLDRVGDEGVKNSKGHVSTEELRKILDKDTALNADERQKVRIAAPVRDRSDDDQRLPRTPAASVTKIAIKDALRVIIAQVDPSGANVHILLEALERYAQRRNRSITVFGEPVMFTSKASKTYMTSRMKKDLGHFGLVSTWARHPADNNDITLSLFCCWTSNPAADSTSNQTGKDDDSKLELHAVVVATIHPVVHGRRSRRAIVIADPNVISLDNHLDTLSEITRKGHLVKMFQAYERDKSRPLYWINRPRGQRNKDGICLALALEWMVEIVVDGLAFTRDSAGEVMRIEGFRGLGALQSSERMTEL
ncbi:hypothetical protein B0H19DRAFT_1240815 [Mycena capillaripes]|nr:hypothetical protein B0H19DRAFT_1240815 [Mycena capillaripes]